MAQGAWRNSAKLILGFATEYSGRRRSGKWTPSRTRLDEETRGTIYEGVLREQCEPVDLSAFTNTAFADEAPGDGKGGWTDQGSGCDMHVMAVGKQTFVGVPFWIIDPDENGETSCILLKGRAWLHLPQSVTQLPVGESYRRLYFLHTCALAKDAGTLFRYVVNCDDGSKVEIPVRRGQEVSDWFDPRDLPGARAA